MAAVVAGSSYRGEFEERLKQLLSELEAQRGSCVLFVDEIHVLGEHLRNMRGGEWRGGGCVCNSITSPLTEQQPTSTTAPAVGAGNSEGGLDFANMLKPALARGQLQCIGATTLDEYRQHIEPDPALSRRFQVGLDLRHAAICVQRKLFGGDAIVYCLAHGSCPCISKQGTDRPYLQLSKHSLLHQQPVLVEEPSEAECLELLKGLAPRYEAHHRVHYSPGALAAAVTSAKRWGGADDGGFQLNGARSMQREIHAWQPLLITSKHVYKSTNQPTNQPNPSGMSQSAACPTAPLI